MSSDVQAKWMNSATRATSGTAANRSFSQYSTALTSWLVCRSIALTRAASAGEKSRPTAASASRAAGENGGTSVMAGSAASARSQAISIRTRWRIRPNSLK